MKTKADRHAAAKKAWETMRARKAQGLAPLSAGKTAKPERDYSGLIGAWLTPAPAQAPEPAPTPKKRRKAAEKMPAKRAAKRQRKAA